VPAVVTAYYDPILEIHHRLPTTFAMTYCFYLAPQVPDEARRLFDAAAASSGISTEQVDSVENRRINAIAWFLAREWGLDSLEATLRASLETHYEPTWDRTRGEFTWGLGLGEEHPRGQYNGFLAAGEAASPGAWSAISAAPLPAQPGLVDDVDFPAVALAEARWDQGRLRLRLHPQRAEPQARPTQFRVIGLEDATRWQLEGDGHCVVDGDDLIIETTIADHRLLLVPSP
jgi:hypothetical protein